MAALPDTNGIARAILECPKPQFFSSCQVWPPNSPKGEDFAQRRKKDVQIRLHAWKRLIDAIDPNWDPNDKPVRNVVPPTETGLPSGVTPEAIKDSKLRAEYIQAIDKNRKKAEKYLKQSKLLDWLKRYPKSVERDIVLVPKQASFLILRYNESRKFGWTELFCSSRLAG